MFRSISKSLLLLAFAVGVCCVIYPLSLWIIGQTFFPFQSNGSLVKGPDATIVGSRLIAQPFTKDEYFQPRPSAPSYDASASASSALAASNYALRDRVARSIGPVAVYKGGPKDGKPVAPEVEQWFRKDMFQGKAGIVAQWADQHNSLAQAWVTADPKNGQYVDEWAKKHPDAVAQWVKENPATLKPKAPDLAVVFFKQYSKDHPGTFPSAVTHKGAGGTSVTTIEPVKKGSDIQSIFFEMWREDHPDVGLQEVPGDMVMASGSGLDPHITLQNAQFQLDRVAAAWAKDLKRDPAAVRKEIEQILEHNASAPFDGLTGEKFVNVLEINLELRKLYGAL